MTKDDEILIKRGEQLIPIRDLSKKEYEEFLELMNKLRMTYIALIRDYQKK